MRVRPKFLRIVGGSLIFGLLIIGYVYFQPQLELPRRAAMDCPLFARLMPLSKAPIHASDSLELSTYIGNPAVPYTIRIFGDGHAEPDTTITLSGNFVIGCPLHQEDRHLQFAPSQASELLRKARDGGFCRLCALYQSTKEQGSSAVEELTLNINGDIHHSYNVSGNPPPIFEELVTSLNAISSIPDYATTSRPSKQRMMECTQIDKARADKLIDRFNKH
jgi:hypothetical protein